MHDDDGYDAAQERRAEEREQDLREEGRFPFRVHVIRSPVSLVLSRETRERIAARANDAAAAQGVTLLPLSRAALPAGPVPMVLDTDPIELPSEYVVEPGTVAIFTDGKRVEAEIPPEGIAVRAGQRLGVLLDTDENGDLRGRVAVADPTGRHAVNEHGDCASWCPACRNNMADGLNPDGTQPEETGSFGDPERAPPDPEDEAVIRHATATVERPAPLLPAAELFFAAACKATSAVRGDVTAPPGIRFALRAATLARELAVELELALCQARDLRDRQFPKVCVCGAHYTREQWLALKSHGVQQDSEGDLDLRACVACGSTIAMPVSVL